MSKLELSSYLIIGLICPWLGGLPLIKWITFALTGNQLAQSGTGNISVSAAFYHGGKIAGILAVLSEAAKGIIAVILARFLFPDQPVWELIALIALVIGRYFLGKSAGTTNVVWGIAVYDPRVAGLVFLLSLIGFSLWRDRQVVKYGVLVLMVLVITLLHPQETNVIIAVMALASLLTWIYQNIPDDLDLSSKEAKEGSKTMFSFLQGKNNGLNRGLKAEEVGEKAANLGKLKGLGYAVPAGWILKPQNNPQILILSLNPSQEQPLIVRSSAKGEDTELASSAGQYETIGNITSREALRKAIADCRASYNSENAVKYRQDKNQDNQSMAILIQVQIKGAYSGVVFSRDPLEQLHNTVIIEALPGDAAQVVSGKTTPQQYKAYLSENSPPVVKGEGDIPQEIIQSVVTIAREIEDIYHGIPQDIEWTHDGEKLWILQTRPITNLQPIWTRKIAAEVIPGFIRPLTWSINQPLTCGVWGQIFSIVLGKRAKNLDFKQTATLHYHRAYFNATLLGEIFRRMGLPPESLEFLTRGAKFSKPPLTSTLINIPGLWALFSRERNLIKDFAQDEKEYFLPILNQLKQPADELSEAQLLERIEAILSVLEKATYYSILAPLSLALRLAIFKVSVESLDNSQTPEVKSVHQLELLAHDAKNLLGMNEVKQSYQSCAALFAYLAEITEGANILTQLDQWLDKYGYLSEVATDIAVARWKEDSRPVRELFTKFLFQEKMKQPEKSVKASNWKIKLLQKRLDLKGKVTEIYSQLLAHLRWSFVSLEAKWLESGLLANEGEIFFLKLPEIIGLIKNEETLTPTIPNLVQQRKTEFDQSQGIKNLPYVVYGNLSNFSSLSSYTPLSGASQLQGIAASPGIKEGKIKIISNWQTMTEIDKQTIVVVPYTDSGWAPMLVQAGGLIAEVGGRLSHGAIIAREYGIPAVMDIHDASQLLHDGQQVRIDGQRGVVEILDEA